jgi:hypothetical protein
MGIPSPNVGKGWPCGTKASARRCARPDVAARRQSSSKMWSAYAASSIPGARRDQLEVAVCAEGSATVW